MIRYGRLDEKPRIIRSLIKEDTRALIFVNSNESAVALDDLLKKSGVRCESIAKSLENWQRKNAIKKFKKGKISGLIFHQKLALIPFSSYNLHRRSRARPGFRLLQYRDKLRRSAIRSYSRA